jgi:hypothetical protein
VTREDLLWSIVLFMLVEAATWALLAMLTTWVSNVAHALWRLIVVGRCRPFAWNDSTRAFLGHRLDVHAGSATYCAGCASTRCRIHSRTSEQIIASASGAASSARAFRQA